MIWLILVLSGRHHIMSNASKVNNCIIFYLQIFPDRELYKGERYFSDHSAKVPPIQASKPLKWKRKDSTGINPGFSLTFVFHESLGLSSVVFESPGANFKSPLDLQTDSLLFCLFV